MLWDMMLWVTFRSVRFEQSLKFDSTQVCSSALFLSFVPQLDGRDLCFKGLLIFELLMVLLDLQWDLSLAMRSLSRWEFLPFVEQLCVSRLSPHSGQIRHQSLNFHEQYPHTDFRSCSRDLGLMFPSTPASDLASPVSRFRSGLIGCRNEWYHHIRRFTSRSAGALLRSAENSFCAWILPNGEKTFELGSTRFGPRELESGTDSAEVFHM
jgi:hypothetical protein